MESAFAASVGNRMGVGMAFSLQMAWLADHYAPGAATGL